MSAISHHDLYYYALGTDRGTCSTATLSRSLRSQCTRLAAGLPHRESPGTRKVPRDCGTVYSPVYATLVSRPRRPRSYGFNNECSTETRIPSSTDCRKRFVQPGMIPRVTRTDLLEPIGSISGRQAPRGLHAAATAAPPAERNEPVLVVLAGMIYADTQVIFFFVPVMVM